MALDIDIKMNGSKQHVVLGLLLLVLTAGYTSGSVLSSNSMLAPQEQASTGYDGPHPKIWSDSQCANIGDIFGNSPSQCMAICDRMPGCTAINYAQASAVYGSGCVLRQCNYPPVPPPQWDYADYVGYSKKVAESKNSTNSTKAYEESEGYETPQNSTKAHEDQEDPYYRECVEGTRWTEECNICECSFGQALCTMKTCLPECVHGTFWEDGCNVCECYEGEVKCTERKCLSDTAPTCAEGSSWAQDCNICICSNGITSCSKEICPAEGAVTTTQLPELTDTKECNGTFAGCNVMQGAKRKQGLMRSSRMIKIPSELNFCIYSINGQQEYFAYIEKCYKAGKLACAYCKGSHKYNARTCKCHKKSRFRGSKNV